MKLCNIDIFFCTFQLTFSQWCSQELAKIHEKCVENEKGCLLWSGGATFSKKAKYGQKRFSVPQLGIKSRVFYVHRLVYMLETENFNIPGGNSRGSGPLEISHLCHNSLCARPDHLVAESHAVNAERVSCRATPCCVGTHEPACIL